jgi:hypothetical protein
MRQNIVSHRSACIFHERERWHAEALAGGAVNGSHFFRSHDFHKRQCSVASSVKIRSDPFAFADHSLTFDRVGSSQPQITFFD